MRTRPLSSQQERLANDLWQTFRDHVFARLTTLTRGNMDTNAKSLRNSCFRDRSEKTGITMYLSTLFYRLANAPLRTPQV